VYPGSIADEMGIIQNDNIRIQKWLTYQEEKAVILQFILEGLSVGYMQSMIQIGSYYGVNQFF